MLLPLFALSLLLPLLFDVLEEKGLLALKGDCMPNGLYRTTPKGFEDGVAAEVLAAVTVDKLLKGFVAVDIIVV